MTRKDEIQTMTDAIIAAHDGQAYFNFTEAHKIIGCGINSVPSVLYRAGILVKKIGRSKRVSALDLATAMYDGRIAPIDNTSRGG